MTLQHCCTIVLLVSLVLIEHGKAARSRPVGRVLRVAGTAEIAGAKDKHRPAALFGSIYDGEQVHLRAQSSIDIGFHAGGKIERIVAGDAVRSATVTELGIEPREGVSLIKLAAKQQPLVRRGIQDIPPIAPGGVSVSRGPPPDQPPPRVTPIAGSSV